MSKTTSKLVSDIKNTNEVLAHIEWLRKRCKKIKAKKLVITTIIVTVDEE